MLKSTIACREQELEELKGFNDKINKEISDIVGTLNWTMESVTNVKEYLTCPYDPSHRLTEQSLNDHLTFCQWKAEGYRESDISLPEPILPSDSPFSIQFNVKLRDEVLTKARAQNPAMQIANYECYCWSAGYPICMGERLIPHTSDRLLADFTSDERKTLYDYTVANTVKPDIGQDIADINNLKPEEGKNKELSLTELLVQERNLKRRRAKHKGVHTNKKSNVEILREVINQQMEIYKEHISGQTDSEHATDAPSIKTEDSNYEMMQNRIEYLYKVNHPSSQNYDNFNFRERNDDCHYSKKDNLYYKREHMEKESYHRSRDRDKRHRYPDEHDETYKKHNYSEHRKSSHSRERKSHKKDKHRSRDRHKDKHHKKKHRSRDRERSSEKYHTKHSDHRRKEKHKEY